MMTEQPAVTKSSVEISSRNQQKQQRRKSRCDESVDFFKQLRSRTKIRSGYVKRSVIVASLYECEKICLQESLFKCSSFNYMPKFKASLPANCELSDTNYRTIDLTNPSLFEISDDHDFYGRDAKRSIEECIDGEFINKEIIKRSLF